MTDNEPSKVEEVEAQVATSSHSSGPKRINSSHSGMESSVFRFKEVNFTVGKDDKKKYLLTDVSETVKWGRVLASKSWDAPSEQLNISASHPVRLLAAPQSWDLLVPERRLSFPL